MMRNLMLQLIVVVLLSYSISSSTARKMSIPGVVLYCGRTTYPGVCTSAMQEYGGAFRAGLNAEEVLKMHLGAINHRSDSASRMAKKMMRKAKPGMRAALKHCTALYRTKGDMIAVTLQELHSKDEQTKQMVRIMLQMMRQSVQECDQRFQQSRIPNPLVGVNRSIFMLATNSDDLTNMMT